MIVIAKIFEKIVFTENLGNLGLSLRKLPFFQGTFPTHENCLFGELFLFLGGINPMSP